MKTYLNILKPKSKEDIVRDLSSLSQKEKNNKLRIASMYGQLEVVKLLIKVGADVNFQDKRKYTALMYASYYDYENIVKLLIEVGANVNAKDAGGYTALKLAIESENKKIIKLLKNYNNEKIKGN